MIPSKPSDAMCRRFVVNIIMAYGRATDEQKAKGKQWYPVAHDLAGLIAGGNTYQGAGVLAALSANKAWPENIRLATRAFDEGKPSGHFRDALHKATRIMDGADPADVLPMSAKTGQFFRCIANPLDADAVVIDRHAHDAAIGQVYGNTTRGLSVANRYNALADCYRKAASRLGILPMTLQAVVWVSHIESIRRIDAYGYEG